jgi:hypothetical protein
VFVTPDRQYQFVNVAKQLCLAFSVSFYRQVLQPHRYLGDVFTTDSGESNAYSWKVTPVTLICDNKFQLRDPVRYTDVNVFRRLNMAKMDSYWIDTPSASDYLLFRIHLVSQANKGASI